MAEGVGSSVWVQPGGEPLEPGVPSLHEMYQNMLVSRFTDRYHAEMAMTTGESVRDLQPSELALLDVLADEAVIAMTGTLLQLWERLSRLHKKVNGPVAECNHCKQYSNTGMPGKAPWPCETAKVIQQAFDELDRIRVLE